LGDRYVNPVVAPHYLDQDFTTITPTNYLLRTAPVTKVEHIIEAVRPDAQTRRLLEIDADEPCLVLHRQTWHDALVSTHSRFSYPGSRYRIGGRFTPVVKYNAQAFPKKAQGGLP
jgi:GntR family histidine utilization transcriptional repressor